MHKITQIRLYNQYLVNTAVVLGRGSTGTVYEGHQLSSGAKVAVKAIDLATIDNEVMEYLLLMEKTALMALDSPSILKGLRVIQDLKYCFIVTEYCNGDTLKDYIQSKGRLTQEKAMDMIRRILEGYQHLVSQGIVHRDLKPANIMLHDEKPKIIDFGYCEIKGFVKPSLDYNVGSPSYMAPQSFQNNLYNEKTEIWAIGVIFYECLTGKPIDSGEHMSLIYQKIKQSGVPYPSYVSQNCRNIINWCLQLNPQKRPTCLELVNRCFRPQMRQRSSSSIQQKVNFFRKNKEANISLSNSKFLDQSERPIKPSNQRPIYEQKRASHSYSMTTSSLYPLPLACTHRISGKTMDTHNQQNDLLNPEIKLTVTHTGLGKWNSTLKKEKCSAERLSSTINPAFSNLIIPNNFLPSSGGSPKGHIHRPSISFNLLAGSPSSKAQNQKNMSFIEKGQSGVPLSNYRASKMKANCSIVINHKMDSSFRTDLSQITDTSSRINSPKASSLGQSAGKASNAVSDQAHTMNGLPPSHLTLRPTPGSAPNYTLTAKMVTSVIGLAEEGKENKGNRSMGLKVWPSSAKASLCPQSRTSFDPQYRANLCPERRVFSFRA